MDSTQHSKPYLTEKHLADLQSSGLTPDQIVVAGHFSADKAKAKELVGYDMPGLIFRYCDPLGTPYKRGDRKPFYRIKPDWGDRKTEDSPKYLSSQGCGNRPYFSRLFQNWKKALSSIKIDIWETEGEKKGDCACANGLATIAFSGVYGWRDRCDRETGEKLDDSRVLPELNDVEWNLRKVYQCFDSDIIEKLSVQQALAERAYTLTCLGAVPYLVLLPNELDGSKNGLDDFVVRHGIEALRWLAKVASKTVVDVTEREDRDKPPKISLKLEEPDTHGKAVMAWAVLKEQWAFRPGVGWYEWQGTHWMCRSVEEFEATLTQFMDAQNWNRRGSNLISSIIREVRSRLLVREELWNPFGKIAFRNGTLNTQSGEFQFGHSSKDQMTQLRPYDYDLLAQCPTWLHFINSAMEGDEERVQLVRAFFRYAVLPRHRDRKAEIEKAFDLYGRKGTGKGTTLDVLTHLVGIKNIGSASVETFKNSTGLGQLIDKSLAIDYDATGFLENVGAYNRVVSNEPVEVKKLYKDIYTARLGVVVVRAYNEFLRTPDGSEGLDRRIVVIPFKNEPKEVDSQLAEKLEQELSGIFSWCYQMSVEDMKHHILTAGEIRAIAEASIERFEFNNHEYRFLADQFPDGHNNIKAGELYQQYQNWCDNTGQKSKNLKRFTETIRKMGCKRSNGKLAGCYYYTIPAMAKFDVTRHLGIVQRQYADSCRDSSNQDTVNLGDNCRQSGSKTSKLSEDSIAEVIEGEEQTTEISFGFESSTTVSQLGQDSVSTVLDDSPVVSTIPDSSGLCFQAGDRIEALYDGEWQPGTIKSAPYNHPDPRKQITCWRVKLDVGLDIHIWLVGHLRLISHCTIEAS